MIGTVIGAEEEEDVEVLDFRCFLGTALCLVAGPIFDASDVEELYMCEGCSFSSA